MNRTRGFALMELLVVMAIIATLLALMGAGLSAAAGQRDAAQCASNLRQLATANLAYAADNGGRYVQAQEITNLIRWHGVRTSESAPFDPTQGPLAPYLGHEGRIKVCPAFRDALKKESFELGTGGYGYNAMYVGGTPKTYAATFEAELITNIPTPASVLMFADTAFPRADGLQEYAYAEPYQWEAASGKMKGALSPSVHFRHMGRANVAWCDGHVTSETPTRLGGKNPYGGDATKASIGWFGPETNNGFWKPQN